MACLMVIVPMEAAGQGAAAPDEQSRHLAAQLAAAGQALRAASATAAQLAARSQAADAVDQLRNDMQLAQANFSARQAVRDEQAIVYAVAGRPEQQAATLSLLPAPETAGLDQAASGLRAVWRLVGVVDPAEIRPRYTHRYADAEPLAALLGYYRAAAARAGIDWTYLAAINYIESDFGRSDGPSSAGAEGPMQFLPATFQEYGGSGDIRSAHDSIEAAASLLARNGAPANYDRAVLRYNHDSDYLAAVQSYAGAMRADPLWLTRLYGWSTYG